MKINPGDDVTHNGYSIGKLIIITLCPGNGQSFGLVRLHCHGEAKLAQIPMNELKRDTRHTEAAL